MSTLDQQSIMEALLRGSASESVEQGQQSSIDGDAIRDMLDQMARRKGGYGFDVHEQAKLITDEEVAQYREFYPDAPKRSDFEVKLVIAERDLYPNGVMRMPKEEERSIGQAAIEALPSVERNEAGGLSINPGDLAGGLIQGAVSEFGKNIASGLGTVMRATGNTREAALYDVVREDIERRAPDAKGIAGGAGMVIGGLAPTGPAVLTGSGAKAMMAIYGLTAFGGGTAEYRDVMKERGLDSNVADEIAHGLGSALTEIVAERLGLEALMRVAPRVGQAVGAKALSGKYKEAAEIMGEVAGGAVVNMAEETITQVANNARARYGFYGAEGFDPDRSLVEGGLEAAAGGALGGSVAARAGRFGRDRRLGEYGTGGRFDVDAYERQKAEIEQRVAFQEELRAKAAEAAERVRQAQETREAFVPVEARRRGEDGQQQPTDAASAFARGLVDRAQSEGAPQGGLTVDEVFGRPDAATPQAGPQQGQLPRGPIQAGPGSQPAPQSPAPQEPAGPHPTRVLEDGTALFDSEQDARAFAREINKQARPGEQTAEVNNLLGSETWTVTVPQAAQRASRGSVTERNRAINRVVNPAQDPNYDPSEGMSPDELMPQQRAMPLAETLDRILSPLEPLATPIEVEQPAPVASNETPSGDTQADSIVTGEQQAEKQPWEMTAEEYASRQGVERPRPGFGVDVSLTQLNFMSDGERRDRSNKRREASKAYSEAESKWKDQVFDAYQRGEFSSSQVYDTEAFYVLSERNFGQDGLEVLSPFRLSTMTEQERSDYLSVIDRKARPVRPELPETVAGDISEPGRSPESGSETRSAEAGIPESGQRTGQVASEQDTAPIASRTEPRRTEVPSRADLQAMPYQRVRQMAKDAGIPANQSKRALAEALTSDTLPPAEGAADADPQTQGQSVPTDDRQRQGSEQAEQVPGSPGTEGQSQRTREGRETEPGVTRSSRAAIERRLIDATQDIADATDQMEIARMEADAENNYSPVSFSFTGPLPEELAVHLRRRPNLLRWVSTNSPRGEGMDTFFRLGADRMIEILEDFAGSKLTRAKRAAEQAQSDEARYLGFVVEDMPVKLDGMKFEEVDPQSLNKGDEFQIHDATFTVDEIDGQLVLIEEMDDPGLDTPTYEEMMADDSYSELDWLNASDGQDNPETYYIGDFTGGIPINAGSMIRAGQTQPVQQQAQRQEQADTREPWQMTRDEWMAEPRTIEQPERDVTLSEFRTMRGYQKPLDEQGMVRYPNGISKAERRRIDERFRKMQAGYDKSEAEYESIKAKGELPRISPVRSTEGAAGDLQSNQAFMRSHHKRSVVRALSDGKPVPDAVLADYPELQQQQRDLLGTPITEANTGRQQGMFTGEGRGGAQFDLTAQPGDSQAARDAQREAIPDDPDQMVMGDDTPAARPQTRWRGDLAEYTGNTDDQGGTVFYEIRLLEGAREGETVLTSEAPDGSDPVAEQNQRDRQETQEQLDRMGRKQEQNRLQQLGQKMIDRAEARQKQNRNRLYSNPLPEIGSVLEWSIGQLIKGVGNLTEFRRSFRSRWGDGYTNDQIRDVYMVSREQAASMTVEPDRRQVKTKIRQITGLADASRTIRQIIGDEETTTTEAKELRKQFKRDEQTARKAFRDGVRSVKDTLPALRQAVQDAQKLKDQAKADRIDGIRRQIRRMVEENLHPSLHGKFLPELTNAKTTGNLITAIDKIRRELARYDARHAINSIKQLAGPRALSKLDNETRTAVRASLREAQPHIETVKAYGRGRVSEGIQTNDIVAASEALNRIEREIAEVVGYYKALQKAFGAKVKATRDQHAKNVVQNINASKRTTRDGGEGQATDPVLGVMRRANTALSDSRLIIRTIEGKADGTAVLEDLIYATDEGSVVHGEHMLLGQRRDDNNYLNELVKRAGFKSLPDAMSRSRRDAGRGRVQTFTVTIGGKKETLTLGELLHIHAMDSGTRAKIAAGVPLQSLDGKSGLLHITIDEVEVIDAMLTDGHRLIVQGVKGKMEEHRASAFAVSKELTGSEPDVVPGYFPRAVARDQSENAGLPEIARNGTATRYLENLGFTKDRETSGGSKSAPIILGDFFTIANKHLDDMAKLTHLGIPIRNAGAVLLEPEVQRAIIRRHGKARLDALKSNLAHMSRANAGQSLLGGKQVADLNTSAAVAFLGANPGTWMRQLAGSARMLPLIDARDTGAGLAAIRTVKMSDLVNNSGYFWERYVGNMTGRFSAVLEGKTADVVDSELREIMGRAAANLRAGDIAAAFSDARTAAQKPLEIMNWFDALNARFAWGAMRNRVDREHPEWSEARKIEWVAIEAANLVRRTQNSTSPIDTSHIANSARNTGASLLLLFSSEVARARNRVYEGFQESKQDGAKALSAEMVNIGLSSVVIAGGYNAMTVALASLLTGDFDEFWERFFGAMLPNEFTPKRLLSDAAGSLVEPYITPRLLEAWTSWDTSISADGPAMDLIADSMRGFKGVTRELTNLVTDDDFDIGKFLRSMEKSVNSGMAALGLNPFYAPYSKVRRGMDKIQEENDSDRPMPF